MNRLIVLAFTVVSATALAQTFEGIDLGTSTKSAPKKAPAPKPAARPASSSTTTAPNLDLGSALAEPAPPTPAPTTPPPAAAEPAAVTPAPTPTTPPAAEPTPATPEPADPGAASAAPTTTTAAPEAAPTDEGPFPSIEISLKGGVHLPQIANPLETSFDALLKVGYGLPFWQRRVQLFVDLSYTQPSTTSTGSDARLPGGTFSSVTTVRDLATSFGAQVFILPPSRLVVPYLSAGVRVHFLKVETNGEAGGAAFGPYTETDTRAGGVFAAGAGLRLGPGRVLAELVFNVLPVDQRLTGASNASSLSVLLGYGLFF